MSWRIGVLKRSGDDEGSEGGESGKRNVGEGGGGEKEDERERSEDEKEKTAIQIG